MRTVIESTTIKTVNWNKQLMLANCKRCGVLLVRVVMRMGLSDETGWVSHSDLLERSSSLEFCELGDGLLHEAGNHFGSRGYFASLANDFNWLEGL